MNESKMSFKCELNFEIDDVDYFVRRVARRDKNGNVRVEVDFWKEKDGNKVNLNDESRRSTNEVIRSYIGSYDDFVLTSLSPQNNKGNNFAEKGQTERKDLITKFLGIEIFDTIYQIALEDYKKISDKVKSIDFEEIYGDINRLESEIGPLTDTLQQMLQVKNIITEEHNKILKKIIEKGSQIKNIDGVTENISNLEVRLNALKEKIGNLEVERWEEAVRGQQYKISEELEKIDSYENSGISIRFKKFESKKRELSDIQSKIDMLKLDVKNKLEKVKFLDSHEYDPNCEYCIKNLFVQDALKAKSQLNELVPVVNELVNQKEQITGELGELSIVESEQRDFDRLKTFVSGLKDDLHRFQNRLIDEKAKQSQTISDIKNLEEKISKYYNCIDTAKKNERLETEIRGLHIQERELFSKINRANSRISDVQSDIKTKSALIEEKKNRLEKFKELEIENKAYQIYIDTIHRDGVPYDIISKSVPTIEKEVNEILSQIVEFGIMLDLDGKNINANLVYTDRLWPIELGSGMESFITNLSLRIALTNISNMPKTNFLAIDEGFGALDEDTFGTIPALFSYLRNSFEFILIISHIDQVKDFVDTQIEIRKENGFSNVNVV
jgi:exonuclease SbcC